MINLSRITTLILLLICIIYFLNFYSLLNVHHIHHIIIFLYNLIAQLEIAAGGELTEEFFQEELHPKISLHQPKFAKPKGPPNRGAKRITKVQELASSGQEN